MKLAFACVGNAGRSQPATAPAEGERPVDRNRSNRETSLDEYRVRGDAIRERARALLDRIERGEIPAGS